MEKAREHWSSKIGFLFAAMGSAIGLGVLWMFPYTVGKNGGGLFLLSYILCILFIGIPVFIGELLMGRRAAKAAIGCFDVLGKEKKFWKLSGWLGTIASFFIMSYYSVISGWGISYILMSLCGFYKGLDAEEVKHVFTMLSSSGGISTLWHFIFTGITMLIVFLGVREGIEFWSKIMMRGLFIILICLMLFALTLPGFKDAVYFVFYPNPETFGFSSVIEALGLAFFTLSLGQGIMLSYGSYMRHDDNVPFMSFVVAFSVIIVAILVALTIFPIVFSFGYEPAGGPGLVFQTLPYLFGKLPAGQMIATVFFILFVFTALTSAVAFIEVVSSNLMELYQISRKKAALIVSMGTFLFGIPSAYAASKGIFPEWQEIYGINFLETMSNLVSNWLIPIGGLLTSLFIGWVWEPKESLDEFVKGCKWKRIFPIWHFFLKWIVPFLILLIFLQKSDIINFDRLLAH